MKFSDIKVLKGNLQALPFPKLTQQQDEALCELVTEIQASDFTEAAQERLNQMVYDLFSITPAEQSQIAMRM
jgi:hypothetical protein